MDNTETPIKALIKGHENDSRIISIDSVDSSIAYHGLEEMNASIDIEANWWKFNSEDFKKYDLCVGGVFDCKYAMKRLGVENYDISCYPDDLSLFFKNRNIQKSRVKNIIPYMSLCNDIGHRFVKPVSPKMFNAFTTNNKEAFESLYGVDSEEEIYTADIVHFISEWRVYVQSNKIVRVCNYAGNPQVFPNTTVINTMIDSWAGPCCYALDVGIVGYRTTLVEVNDFYAIGNYGLHPSEYAEMLTLRWTELTAKKRAGSL